MDSDLQLTAWGEPYARPYIPVGAHAGFDEMIFEAFAARDEDDTPRQL